MRFINEDKNAAVQAIASRSEAELMSGKQVLWLVSGGSNITLEVEIMKALRTNVSDKLTGLTILPMDERYGPPGHINSNTEALRSAGFDQGLAVWTDVLSLDLPFAETVEYYNYLAADALAEASVVIAQFGLGADGHVAGILPGSPACDEDYATVVGYEWNDYTRLTLSPRALADAGVAYVPVYGDNKRSALERLFQNQESLQSLPAKLLRQIPEVYVYNEIIESEG